MRASARNVSFVQHQSYCNMKRHLLSVMLRMEVNVCNSAILSTVYHAQSSSQVQCFSRVLSSPWAAWNKRIILPESVKPELSTPSQIMRVTHPITVRAKMKCDNADSLGRLGGHHHVRNSAGYPKRSMHRRVMVSIVPSSHTTSRMSVHGTAQ